MKQNKKKRENTEAERKKYERTWTEYKSKQKEVNGWYESRVHEESEIRN